MFGNSDGSKKQNQGFSENKIWLKDFTLGFADETSTAIWIEKMSHTRRDIHVQKIMLNVCRNNNWKSPGEKFTLIIDRRIYIIVQSSGIN